MIDYSEVGKRIKYYRQKRGLTQEQLAFDIHSADLRPQPKMKMEPTSALTCYNAHGNNNR